MSQKRQFGDDDENNNGLQESSKKFRIQAPSSHYSKRRPKSKWERYNRDSDDEKDDDDSASDRSDEPLDIQQNREDVNEEVMESRETDISVDHYNTTQSLPAHKFRFDYNPTSCDDLEEDEPIDITRADLLEETLVCPKPKPPNPFFRHRPIIHTISSRNNLGHQNERGNFLYNLPTHENFTELQQQAEFTTESHDQSSQRKPIVYEEDADLEEQDIVLNDDENNDELIDYFDDEDYDEDDDEPIDITRSDML